MSESAKTCVFCGSVGKLTGEHVFGDWLTRTGLSRDPVLHGAGPLNRSPRNLGTTPPFMRKVTDVCGPCNHGWMSKLEATAKSVLTPLILGTPGSVPEPDAGAIAAWVQKTALVGMLVSSEGDRAEGYGVPAQEYRDFYAIRDQRTPLTDSQFWIGRYAAKERLAVVWVTPMVVSVDGLPDVDLPRAYVMTVLLGELVLQGVRFVKTGLRFELKPVQQFALLWPSSGPTVWPAGASVDDEELAKVCKGLNLAALEPALALRPWGRATDLPSSEGDGLRVRLPTPCGKHFVSYPSIFICHAARGELFAFVASCGCGTTYLVKTASDRVTFKSEGARSAILARYSALPGEDLIRQDAAAEFPCKRLSPLV